MVQLWLAVAAAVILVVVAAVVSAKRAWNQPVGGRRARRPGVSTPTSDSTPASDLERASLESWLASSGLRLPPPAKQKSHDREQE
jgi:hypothetical protein